MRTANFKYAVVFFLLLGLLVFIACQHFRAADLADENARLKNEMAQHKEAEETNNISESQLAQAQSVNRAQLKELLRLRTQVTSLRAQLPQPTRQPLKAPPSSPVQKADPDVSSEERYAEDIIPRATFAHQWMAALNEYATKNQGRFPTNFDQAAPFLSADAQGQTNVATNEFEIVFQGSQNALTNQGDDEVIVLRERQLRHRYDGKWGRVYGLADGSSLQRFFETQDALTQWEQDHLRNTASP